MKTLSLAVMLVAGLAFVLAGCSDNPGAPVTPSEQAVGQPSTAVSLAKANKIVHSATGACNDFFEGKMQSWAFNAKQYEDGTCDGVVQIVVHSQPRDYGFLHCKVLSLKVYDLVGGGKAAVIGMIEIEKKGLFTGSYDAFVVYDYGEGSKAHPDMYTTCIFWDANNIRENVEAVWNMPPDQVVQKIVELHPPLTWDDILLPVREGNVQVR